MDKTFNAFEVESTIWRKTYLMGKRYFQNSCLTINTNGQIHEGFHSYITFKRARRKLRLFGEVIVEAKIPKGSRYYKNNFYKEYVSNSIILNVIIYDSSSKK